MLGCLGWSILILMIMQHADKHRISPYQLNVQTIARMETQISFNVPAPVCAKRTPSDPTNLARKDRREFNACRLFDHYEIGRLD